MAEKNDKDCVFCRIAKGEIESKFLYQDDNLMIFNDLHPLSEGHCLIVSKKHYATLLDVPSTLGTELIDAAKKQGARLIKEKRAEGFNLVQNNFKSAGQIVPHFHIHLIPRKSGDGIKLG